MLTAESNISTTAKTLQGSTEGIPRVNPRTVRLGRCSPASLSMPYPATRRAPSGAPLRDATRAQPRAAGGRSADRLRSRTREGPQGDDSPCGPYRRKKKSALRGRLILGADISLAVLRLVRQGVFRVALGHLSNRKEGRKNRPWGLPAAGQRLSSRLCAARPLPIYIGAVETGCADKSENGKNLRKE